MEFRRYGTRLALAGGVKRSSVRTAHGYQVLTIAVCGLVVLSTGCDECDQYGQTRCEGDVLQECIDDGDGPFANFRWQVRGCAVTCHAAAGRAACVDSRQPVPECADDPNGEICFEGAPSGCWDGYPQKGPACGSTTHCVMSAACGPVCVTGDAPDPRCAQDFFCESGDAVTSCICGHVAYRFPCSAGLSCQEMRGEAHCLSPAPDPRCGDPAQQSFSFCEGNTLNVCWFGYLSRVNDCAGSPSAPGRCEMVGTPSGQPSCVFSISI
jgi:hypothetical protein